MMTDLILPGPVPASLGSTAPAMMILTFGAERIYRACGDTATVT